MLHGWGQTLSSLRPLGELLADSHDVHLIDLPGFGKTAAPSAVWNSDNYAKCLIHYLDQHNLATVDIIGHSFGGKVALTLASHYPERVSSLVIMAASGLPKKRSLFSHIRMLALKWTAKLLKAVDKLFGTNLFQNQFAPRFGSSDYKKAGNMKDILVKTVNENLTEAIKKISAPTLILWGEKDSETPAEVAERMQTLIKNSKAYIFPGKDHHLYHDGGSHLAASYIKPFLAKKRAT